MWGVNPILLCNKHLLGEHVEMHMFVGAIKKGTSIKGFVENKLVDTCLIKNRHDELAKEMQKRGMVHKSPLEYIDTLQQCSVDICENKKELQNRCSECKKRQECFEELDEISLWQTIVKSPINQDFATQYLCLKPHEFCEHLSFEDKRKIYSWELYLKAHDFEIKKKDH
jgi:hypothetical protein